MTYVDGLDPKLFGPLELRLGPGKDFKNGLCFMEAVSWLDGGEATDKPDCACGELGDYAIFLNDHMGKRQRQSLLPLAYEMAGTKSEKYEDMRNGILGDHTRLLILGFINTLEDIICEGRLPNYEYDIVCNFLRDFKPRCTRHIEGVNFISRGPRSKVEAACRVVSDIVQNFPRDFSFRYRMIEEIDFTKPMEIYAGKSTMTTETRLFMPVETLLNDMKQVLHMAIRMGPNGSSQWYEPGEWADNIQKQASKLGQFAAEELVKV